MLLLRHVGAKTSKERTSALLYVPDGDRYAVIASKGGAPNNPAWYHNLLTHPTVTVEVGTEKFEAEASVVTGAERDGDALVVTWRERAPGRGDMTAQVITFPYHLVRVPRHDGPVRFERARN